MNPLYDALPPIAGACFQPDRSGNTGSVRGMTVNRSDNDRTHYAKDSHGKSQKTRAPGLYERGLTFLFTLAPRLRQNTQPEQQPLSAGQFKDFANSPLMKALETYRSVPLRQLLSTIHQDYQTRNERYPAAQLFTEQMTIDHRQEPRGIGEKLLLSGSGASDVKDVYPRMALLMQTINLLLTDLGDITTSDVFKALFDHACDHPGSLSYRLITAFISAPDDRKVPAGNPARTSHANAGWSAKGIMATFLAAFWAQFSTARATSQNTTHHCQPTQFPCASGACIDRRQVCDGLYDCGLDDRSDESATVCPRHCEATNRFLCKTISQCISREYQCDGDFDCKDGSDERSPPCPCPTGTVLCDDGLSCIEEEKLCDGKKQCADGSDESYQHCQDALTRKIHQWQGQSPANQLRLKKVCCGQGLFSRPVEELFERHGLSERNCSEIGSMWVRRRCGCRDRSAVLYCDAATAVATPRDCIGPDDLCNGYSRCTGARDEAPDFCLSRCPEYRVSCGDHRCIDPRHLCNGVRDCANGRDEDQYTCLMETIRIDQYQACKSYSGAAKAACKANLQQSCCAAVNGSVPVTPAPLKDSSSSRPSASQPRNATAAPATAPVPDSGFRIGRDRIEPTTTFQASRFFASVSDSGATAFSTAGQRLTLDGPTTTSAPSYVAPVPCEAQPTIHPFSLGIGALIGAAGAALVCIAGRLCLQANYRSHFPSGLKLANSAPKSFDPEADEQLTSASMKVIWQSKESIPMNEHPC